jgi:hypothetical protein
MECSRTFTRYGYRNRTGNPPDRLVIGLKRGLTGEVLALNLGALLGNVLGEANVYSLGSMEGILIGALLGDELGYLIVSDDGPLLGISISCVLGTIYGELLLRVDNGFSQRAKDLAHEMKGSCTAIWTRVWYTT